ncbi:MULTISPECIES: hypothetical protein [unclassified Mesorhizobium]|nr:MULTISPECIES: hypothetical protein [unclassified Mesorhizobium]
MTIDFAVNYLVEKRDGKLKVFGWTSGDEQAEFRNTACCRCADCRIPF